MACEGYGFCSFRINSAFASYLALKYYLCSKIVVMNFVEELKWRGIVITSYSIHYTKLYDRLLLELESHPPDEVVVSRDRVQEFKQWLEG